MKDEIRKLFMTLEKEAAGMGEETPRVWITRDGRRMTIEEMDDKHLINSLLRVQRLHWRLAFLPALTAEAKKRKLI